jgi:hypothetical protein
MHIIIRPLHSIHIYIIIIILVLAYLILFSNEVRAPDGTHVQTCMRVRA